MKTTDLRYTIAATMLLAVVTAASHMDTTAIEDNYEAVLYNPAQHEGTRVLWGGTVLSSKHTPEGCRLVMAEIPLDFLGVSGAGKYSRGRFVARSRDSAMADLFDINDLAIIEGTVQGSETQPVGEESKTYPVITIEKITPCRRADGYGYVKGPTGWRRVDGPFCAQNGEGEIDD
jgi:starvation-inducible outer membrane lipoprotein